ncbi:MAG: ABC transporter permease [Chloroflexota bacterium]
MFYELSLLAIGNLARARARLIMTAGGVLVGTTAVVLLIALTFGLQHAAEAGIGSSSALTEIQVYPNYGGGPNGGSSSTEIPQLTVDAVKAFWKIPGVAAVIPMVNLQGGELLANKLTGYAQVIGIDPALLSYLGVTAQAGQLTLNKGEAIVGAHTGDYFYDPKASSDNYQPIVVDLFTTPFKLHLYQYGSSGGQTDRKVDVKVTGLLAEGTSYDYAMLMPLSEVLKYNEWITDTPLDPKTFHYDQVTVRASSRETTNDVSQAIRDLGYGAGGMGDYLNQLNSFFTTMRLMLGGVGGVALLVAAFGVANTMTMAILERTKEIGLMKAIGATDRDVLTVFLIEAGLVGLAGGAAGVALSLFLQNVINQAVANAPAAGQQGGIGLPFDTSQIGGNLVVIPPELTIFALVLATAVGLGAGLYPALRAARLPPVIALKSE